MKFQITTENVDGARSVLFYDNQASTLTDHSGIPIPLNFADFNYTDDIEYEDWATGSIEKSRGVTTLKVQLGMGCNYSCSYCSQAGQKPVASKSAVREVEAFCEKLDGWVEDPQGVKRIEFWGGEPLLYWKHIQALAPKLRYAYPNARFTMITNGSLLTDDHVDFLIEYDFIVAISHDGPGQEIRGEDPFDNPEWVKTVQRLYDLHGVEFNMVLTKKNKSPAAAIEWFHERFQRPVICNIESIVDEFVTGCARLDDSDRNDIRQNLVMELITGKLHDVSMLTWKLKNFYETLAFKRPAKSIGQKCGMDRPDYLAVDLKGNMITCQNTAAGLHTIGDLVKGGTLKYNHHTQRPDCANCPVLHFCYGSCMYLEGTEFEETCKNEKAQGMALLQAAVYFLTKHMIIDIQPLGKPEVKPTRKVIPIAVQRS